MHTTTPFNKVSIDLFPYLFITTLTILQGICIPFDKRPYINMITRSGRRQMFWFHDISVIKWLRRPIAYRPQRINNQPPHAGRTIHPLSPIHLRPVLKLLDLGNHDSFIFLAREEIYQTILLKYLNGSEYREKEVVFGMLRLLSCTTFFSLYRANFLEIPNDEHLKVARNLSKGRRMNCSAPQH